jgi:hypothetical protein
MGRQSIVRAALVAIALFGAAAPARAQFDAGMLAAWKDLDTWTTYHEDRKVTELGLGLIATGPQGTMRISFEAMLPGRRPTEPPPRVTLRMAPPAMQNPNVLRSTVLTFDLDERLKERVQYDLSDRVVSLDGTPGSSVTTATASMTIDEFVRFATSQTAKAVVLGIPVEFSAAQLKALRTYADRVMLRVR